MSRIVITLGIAEKKALEALALDELRSPQDEARYLLRQKFKEVGLLTDDDLPSKRWMLRPKGEDKDDA